MIARPHLPPTVTSAEEALAWCVPPPTARRAGGRAMTALEPLDGDHAVPVPVDPPGGRCDGYGRQIRLGRRMVEWGAR
jgi:hypothetical protein